MSKIEQADHMYSVEKQGGVNDDSKIQQSDAILGCSNAEVPNEQLTERKVRKLSESGANDVGEKNETKDSTSFIEKAWCIARLCKSVKELFVCLRNCKLFKPLFSKIKKHREKKKKLAKEVSENATNANKNINNAKNDLNKINTVADQIKKEVTDVSDNMDALLQANKELYNDAVDKNTELRTNIQNQIKELEIYKESRKDASDGLIKELDEFINSTEKECEAILADIEEIDTLLGQFRECKEDEKDSRLKQIQEKEEHVINKLYELQTKQLEFLKTLRIKLSNAYAEMAQQNENLIQELRKIAGSTEDSDAILKKANEEFYDAKTKYEKTKKDHDSWMPAIGWTRPTDKEVEFAEQKFLRAQAKLSILNNIDSDNIKSGLQNLLDDLDEIKNFQENALKKLDDAQFNLDSINNLVNKARRLTRVFSFGLGLDSVQVKLGLIGGTVGAFIAIVAGCSTLPVVAATAGCALIAAVGGKLINEMGPEGHKNSLGDNEQTDDDDLVLLQYDMSELPVEGNVIDQSLKIKKTAEDKQSDDPNHANISKNSNNNVGDEVGNVVKTDGDDLVSLQSDMSESPVERNGVDQSLEVQKTAEDKQGNDPNYANRSKSSNDNAGVRNVDEIDDDYSDFLPQGFDQYPTNYGVIGPDDKNATYKKETPEQPNETDNSNDNAGIWGAIGGVTANIYKDTVNMATNAAGTALDAGKKVIGGCVNFVSKLWPFGNGK